MNPLSIFQKPTVDSITSGLQGMVDQLGTLAAAKDAEATAEIELAKAAEDRAHAAARESERANRVAARINSLLVG